VGDGGTLQILDVKQVTTDPKLWVDSKGNPRGKVMVSTIQGKGVLKPDWGPGYWRALYPAWVDGFPEDQASPTHSLDAPAGVQVDVFVTPNMGTPSLLSVHRKNIVTGDNNSVVALGLDSTNNHNIVLYYVKDGEGNITQERLAPDLWKDGEWNTLKFVIEKDGRAIPYVNGHLAIPDPQKARKVSLTKYSGAFMDAHGGINAATPDEMGTVFKQGGQVWNDNFIVFQVNQ
jgi:hypothetical protein